MADAKAVGGPDPHSDARSSQKEYSLFGGNDIWTACDSVTNTAPQQPEDDRPFNPADDPRVDAFSPKAGCKSNLRALREQSASTCSSLLAALHGIQAHDAVFCSPCLPQLLPQGGAGSSCLSQHIDDSSLGQYLAAAQGQHLDPCFIAPAQDITYGQLPGARVHCADMPAPPQHMATNQYIGMAMHSPQPCVRSWADNVKPTGSMSAPSSPAAPHVHACVLPGQQQQAYVLPAPQPPKQPPPPPRCSPMSQQPPPPPRRRPNSNKPSTTGGSSTGPGTPTTPGITQPTAFGPAGSVHSPLQDKSLQGSILHSPVNQLGSQVQRVLLQGPCAGGLPAGGVPGLPHVGQVSSMQAGSSYGRLLQGVSAHDGLCSPNDPFGLGSTPLAATTRVVGPDAYKPAEAQPTCSPADDLRTAGQPKPRQPATPTATDQPVTPTAPVPAQPGRQSIPGSRLSRSSSSGTSSYYSCDSSREPSTGGAPPAPSRLSATVSGNLARMSSGASSKSAEPRPAPKSTGIPHTQLLFMEMHDVDCSSYCLGGNLEPHKMWFGVGVHRAIRKLVTNNKRRHSLILALHAAGDGSGYGDLGKVYAAVKNMHNGLAAGTGWTSEAGAKLFAGVEELKELLEAALRDGPGMEGYQPPAHLRL